MPRLLLPPKLSALPSVAEVHAFAARNVAIVEAAVFNAFGTKAITELNRNDIDVSQRLIRRPGDARWVPLRTRHWSCWEKLAAVDHDGALFRSKSGRRMTRVDVWRVLRRVGLEAELKLPLHTRRARAWIGYTLARRNHIDGRTICVALGVKDIRALQRYLDLPQPKGLPTEV